MLQSTDAGASTVLTASIKVDQAGAMRSLSISTPSPLTISSAQGMISFSVESNVPWSLVNASIPAWIRPDATSGTGDADIELNYDANASPTPRTATLMLQSTDAGAPTLTASIKVDQEGMRGDVLGFPQPQETISFSPNPVRSLLRIQGADLGRRCFRRACLRRACLKRACSLSAL